MIVSTHARTQKKKVCGKKKCSESDRRLLSMLIVEVGEGVGKRMGQALIDIKFKFKLKGPKNLSLPDKKCVQ